MPVTVPASEPYFMERRGDSPLSQSSPGLKFPIAAKKALHVPGSHKQHPYSTFCKINCLNFGKKHLQAPAVCCERHRVIK